MIVRHVLQKYQYIFSQNAKQNKCQKTIQSCKKKFNSKKPYFSVLSIVIYSFYLLKKVYLGDNPIKEI